MLKDYVFLLVDLSRDSGVPMLTGKCENTNDQLTDQELNEALQLETRKFFAELMQDPNEKKKFIAWLFCLADIDKSNTINTEELKSVLDVISHDGIDAASLLSKTGNVCIHQKPTNKY